MNRSHASNPTAEEHIRMLITERARAVRAKNLSGAVAINAPTVVTYDVLPPLRNRGSAEVQARTERWLSGYPDAPGYEIRELDVVAGDTVAFAYYLYRVSGTLANGDAVNMWVRATLGFQHVDGAWVLVHEHDSVPFDPQSGQARLDLTP